MGLFDFLREGALELEPVITVGRGDDPRCYVRLVSPHSGKTMFNGSGSFADEDEAQAWIRFIRSHDGRVRIVLPEDGDVMIVRKGDGDA